METALALGNFDGLHKGHISVISAAKSFGLPCRVLRFTRHTAAYFCDTVPGKIITESVFDSVLTTLGCGIFPVDFENIRDFSPEEFVYFLHKNSISAVSCGENFTFGKGASGSASLLLSLCEGAGIGCKIAETAIYDGEAVSSTRIRNALKAGEIEAANAMLGRPFCYDFEVVKGDKIGRQLDFPTANQYFPQGFTVPLHGVYSGFTKTALGIFPSVTSIGPRPTVDSSEIRSETHIIGFSGDLYGSAPCVYLCKYLRPLEKFDGLQSLTLQIKKDSETAARLFENTDVSRET